MTGIDLAYSITQSYMEDFLCDQTHNVPFDNSLPSDSWLVNISHLFCAFIRGCQSSIYGRNCVWTKLFIFENFRLNQSNPIQATLTTPIRLKSQKGIFFYLQMNEPIAFERTPPKCLGFLKEQPW